MIDLHELHELVQQKIKETMVNRERLLTVWIAETGLMPSESVLCESESYVDGVITRRVWVEKKS